MEQKTADRLHVLVYKIVGFSSAQLQTRHVVTRSM